MSNVEINPDVPQLEAAFLSEVPQSTLFTFPDKFDEWFRQKRIGGALGVVSPTGATPTVFGDPLVKIVETVEPEPDDETLQWRRKNRARAEIMNLLSIGPTSTPRDRRSLRFYLAHRARELDEAELEAMQDEGILRDGYTTPGLSIHSEATRAYQLTAEGMALAVRKSVDRKLELGRLARWRLMYRQPSHDMLSYSER